MPDPSQCSTSKRRQRAASGSSTVRTKIVLAIGTAACTQLRAFRKTLVEQFGSLPLHIALFGIDTASQPANGLPLLTPVQFINLSASCRQLQAFIRRSMGIRRVAAWLPDAVVNAISGEGAAASPPVARLILEKALPMLDRQLQEVLARFRPPHAADLAPIANQHPSLRDQGAALETSGPIDVIFLASTTGGTVGTLPLVKLWLQARLAELGIDATYSLVLTLPACGGVQGVDYTRMLDNCFGRLSELLDGQHGREVVWQADNDLTFRGRGSQYDSVLVMPEPVAGQLLQHHAGVGRFLVERTSAIPGNLIGQTIVDMLRQFHTSGPCGQPKFLTLVGHSQLQACAFADPAGFAAVRLGLAATAAGPDTGSRAASDLLEKHGCTWSTLKASLPCLERVSAAKEESASKVDALVNMARQNQAKKAAAELARSRERIAAVFQRLRGDALGKEPSPSGEAEGRAVNSGWLAATAREAGPASAAGLARGVLQHLHQLKVYVHGALASPPPETPQNAALVDRLNAVAVQAEHTVREEAFKLVLQEIDLLLTSFEAVQQRYAWLAQMLGDEWTACRRAARSYEPQHAATHAILDHDMLAELIDDEASACIDEVRAAVAAAASWEHRDEERLRAEVRSIVERQSDHWRQCADFDEALRLAGGAAEASIENAISAAEPNVRVDPLWDLNKHAARHLFVTLPEQHPLVAVLERSGRVVRCVAPYGPVSRITLIALDMGVEMAPLAVASEAVQAHLQGSVAGFPPFADKRHEPDRDLVEPEQSAWYVELALPLHWHLQTDHLQRAADGRWTFDGVELGDSYAQAAAHLTADAGRDPRLPSLQQLGEQTRRLLHADGQPIELLESLESSLTEQLHDLRGETTATPADPQWQFALLKARSVARSLARELKAGQRDGELVRKARGRGVKMRLSETDRLSPKKETSEHDPGNGQLK